MKRIIFISVFKNLKSFRADVEKHRMTSNIKRQQMDDSKNEYANQLQKTNELQVGGFPLNVGKTKLGSCLG